MPPAHSSPRICDAPGGGGVVTLALHEVGPVDRARDDVDQHLAGAGDRVGDLRPLEDVGTAVARGT